MKCLRCGAESRVIDSRRVVNGTVAWRRVEDDAGHSVRRRRVCVACGERFTTEERYVFKDHRTSRTSHVDNRLPPL